MASEDPENQGEPELGPQTAQLNLNLHNPVQANLYRSDESKAAVQALEQTLLGSERDLHPLQQAFIDHDAFQCGYCTPGQICSGVAVLAEIKAGIPSHVTADLNAPMQVTEAEIRERMSGNICRCGAYSNIVEAMTEVAGRPA